MVKKNESANPAAALAEGPATKTNIAAPAKSAAPAMTPAGNGNGTPAKAAPKKKPAAKKSKAATKPVTITFSTEDIALRAYFISEHRHRMGLHGDEHSDWIEAERQLRAEHKKKTAKKRAPAKKRA
jgi:hypothetical protein